MPANDKEVVTEDFLFDLGLEHDSGTYLVRVVNLRNNVYSLRAGYLTQYVRATNAISTWNAIYLGFMLFMALYNFFLYVSIKDRAYLYYVGYVATFGFFNMLLDGTASLYLWPSLGMWHSYDNLFCTAATIFTALFTLSFLRLKEHAPGYYKALIGLILVCLVNMAVAVLGFLTAAFLFNQILALITLGLEIISGVIVYNKGYKPARFFLLAWGVSGLCIFGHIFSMHNIIDSGFLTEYGLQIASQFEALILSFALADRFNNYKKEREALIVSQNEMLELKVAERTSELKKQQEESETLLLNILPADVAAELKENGAAKTRNFDAVTVLFTDFKDFTTVVENISPEQLVSELNHCFSAFDNIIEKHGMEKIKTIGDSYMCAGGLSFNAQQNATHVVRAGIEMMEFMNAQNESRQKPVNLYWSCG